MHRRRIEVSLVDQIPEALAPGATVIVCPWLKGLPVESGLWISALPIHDANSHIRAGSFGNADRKIVEQIYLGVFALDRFRPTAQLLDDIWGMGARRLINLPSVSFFDGRSGAILRDVDLGPAREVEFLLQAKDAGFRVALCALQDQAAQVKSVAAFDFLLLHAGPGEKLNAYAR